MNPEDSWTSIATIAIACLFLWVLVYLLLFVPLCFVESNDALHACAVLHKRFFELCILVGGFQWRSFHQFWWKYVPMCPVWSTRALLLYFTLIYLRATCSSGPEKHKRISKNQTARNQTLIELDWLDSLCKTLEFYPNSTKPCILPTRSSNSRNTLDHYFA